METIIVNGKTYYAKNESEDYRICILQRGWTMVGKFYREGMDCELHDAAVLRKWGTSEGLGELHDGPTKETKLDKCNGVVKFDWLTVVATIQVNGDKWKNVL